MALKSVIVINRDIIPIDNLAIDTDLKMAIVPIITRFQRHVLSLYSLTNITLVGDMLNYFNRRKAYKLFEPTLEVESGLCFLGLPDPDSLIGPE